jgi:hypothetical protein
MNRVIVAVLLTLCASCESSVTVVETPADTTDTPPPGVQRATLRVLVDLDERDADVGAALGWDGIDNIHVTIRRRVGGETASAVIQHPGDSAVFGNLLTGSYEVLAYRALTDAELAALPPQYADVTAFGGGAQVSVSAPYTGFRLAALAGRRGTLIFSEFYGHSPVFEGALYDFGHYITIYNNGDAPVLLDGKVLGFALVYYFDNPDHPCDVSLPFRSDADGIWTRHRYVFPWVGKVLQPGQTAVIATDAVNHAGFGFGFDLTGADYEFIGSSDVDNPAVPNMIQIGGPEWQPLLGHGQLVPSSLNAWVLAESLSENELVVGNPPPAGLEHRRIPTDAILDVFHTDSPNPVIPRCADGLMAHPDLDRQHARLSVFWQPESMRRRLFGRLEDGRPILQRTRTSALDFERVLSGPGVLP